MSNEEIFGIIDYLNSLSFSEFEMETSDLKIRIVRNSSTTSKSDSNVEYVTEKSPPSIKNEVVLPCVLAPISGVLYRASAPGEKPFVKVGDKIKEGNTLCILEAMKMMIEVKSDKEGIVKEILGVDGDTVEEGQPIIIFQGE